jgi:hypothetical protein
LSILAFVSYFRVLARFPVTRNVLWVNILLFGAAALFLLTGLKRAFTEFGSIGGKFVSSVLALLSISILGVLCFVVFRATRRLPASHGAPTVGSTAHAPRRSFGAPQNRLFPQLNFHNARVRRNHGRPPPNGFTGRARSFSPTFTPQRERASGKALAYRRTAARFQESGNSAGGH